MKVQEKIICVFFALIIFISTLSNTCAVEMKTKLNIVQKASETKYLEDNQGFISKTIVDSNEETGEVTIELKVSNEEKETEQTKSTEIFLVIDNSPSMDFVTSSGKTRKEIVISSAKTLVNSIFSDINDVTVGIIDFHGSYRYIGDANVRVGLNNTKELLLDDLDNLNSTSTKGGTNIDAGLQQAEKHFSKKDNNKIIILLTDGVPNSDVNGNSAGNDTTTEKAIKVQNNTKDTILRLKKAGINIISMMTGISESDGNTDKNGTVYGDVNVQEELNAIERVFGTTQNPTARKYYLVSTVDIDKVINDDILKDVTDIVQIPMNAVKIVDYFPKDITNNFEFSYVGKPSVGTVSEGIDTQTNTISWDIGTLKGKEVATLKYRLKIKNMKNEELIGKTIATNEKVVLTYKDISDKDYTVNLSSSPKIQLTEIKEQLTATVSYNPTTETTGKVVATIKTNKKVNKVEGWTLSEDGTTLTKTYSQNATETVHLVDLDGMTTDVAVIVKNITNNAPDKISTSTRRKQR